MLCACVYDILQARKLRIQAYHQIIWIQTVMFVENVHFTAKRPYLIQITSNYTFFDHLEQPWCPITILSRVPGWGHVSWKIEEAQTGGDCPPLLGNHWVLASCSILKLLSSRLLDGIDHQLSMTNLTTH